MLIGGTEGPLPVPKNFKKWKMEIFLRMLKSPKMSNFWTFFENGLWAPHMLPWQRLKWYYKLATYWWGALWQKFMSKFLPPDNFFLLFRDFRAFWSFNSVCSKSLTNEKFSKIWMLNFIILVTQKRKRAKLWTIWQLTGFIWDRNSLMICVISSFCMKWSKFHQNFGTFQTYRRTTEVHNRQKTL